MDETLGSPSVLRLKRRADRETKLEKYAGDMAQMDFITFQPPAVESGSRPSSEASLKARKIWKLY